VGALLATYVLETVGTQEYELGRGDVLRRLRKAYGDEAVADVEPHLVTPRP
jgi:adenosine kinase